MNVDKAIDILDWFEGSITQSHFVNKPIFFEYDVIDGIKEAKTELEAHNAKIEELKAYCSEKDKVLNDIIARTIYKALAVKASSNKTIYADILQKLEELT